MGVSYKLAVAAWEGGGVQSLQVNVGSLGAAQRSTANRDATPGLCYRHRIKVDSPGERAEWLTLRAINYQGDKGKGMSLKASEPNSPISLNRSVTGDNFRRGAMDYGTLYRCRSSVGIFNVLLSLVKGGWG